MTNAQVQETTPEEQPSLSNASLEGSRNQQGFELLKAFIDNYNNDSENKIDASDIISKLREQDAVNDDILQTLSIEDIEKITGLSKMLSKAIQKELSSLGKETKTRARRRLTRYGAEALELEDLVGRYDPRDIGSAANIELAKRMKLIIGRNPKVVVFNENGDVNTLVTSRLIQDALQGDPDLDQVQDNGKMYYTCRISELPDQVIEIHPITRNPLRGNGQGQDGLNWKEVPMEARQLLYLATKSEELERPVSRRDVVYYYNLAKNSDGFAQLQTEFPDAARDFDQRQKIGTLPALKKVRSTENTTSSGKLFRS